MLPHTISSSNDFSTELSLGQPRAWVNGKACHICTYRVSETRVGAQFWYGLAMTMHQVTREFLRALRGSRSQVAFARRLKYRGNPVADWEAGRRCPSAAHALHACEVAGIDVAAAFLRFHRVPLTKLHGDFDLPSWLSALKGSTSHAALARSAGYSRHQVARWLKGQTHPNLHEFFQLVEAITGRLCDLVAALVPIASVPSLRADYERREAARLLAHEQPWTEAILRVIETEAYRAQAAPEPGLIARTLGIPPEIEQRCLDKLLHAGIVRKSGERYQPLRSLTVDTRAIPHLKAHWCDAAKDRLQTPSEDDLFSYNVLSASREDIARIRALLLATYREIRTIVEHTERDEAVALVNLQLLCWDPAPTSPNVA